MKTGKIYGNGSSVETEVYINLKEGDILIATGEGDFIRGKKYKVEHIYVWDFNKIAYVVDEHGVSQWATPELFFNIAEYREYRINQILN